MEPEVQDLGGMLMAMGADIRGLGTPTMEIHGVQKLNGVTHDIIPDRIEAETYLTAGLITNGEIMVKACRPGNMKSVIDKYKNCGANLEVGGDYIKTAPSRLVGRDVRTAPYPGFPTDTQAQFVALMTQAHGTSMVTETIFENRFMHVPELIRMGADIHIDGNKVVIIGKNRLSGASVMATDLRASASLVLAGLAAGDQTIVNRVYHIDRGYSHIVSRLQALGARITRVK
jgi:UDP-N-acetylglucosamine 1-carboxyvinyltransferase